MSPERPYADMSHGAAISGRCQVWPCNAATGPVWVDDRATDMGHPPDHACTAAAPSHCLQSNRAPLNCEQLLRMVKWPHPTPSKGVPALAP